MVSHTVRTWSETQGSVTLSSGEAELLAAVRGACEGLGMLSLMFNYQGKVNRLRNAFLLPVGAPGRYEGWDYRGRFIIMTRLLQYQFDAPTQTWVPMP